MEKQNTSKQDEKNKKVPVRSVRLTKSLNKPIPSKPKLKKAVIGHSRTSIALKKNNTVRSDNPEVFVFGKKIETDSISAKSKNNKPVFSRISPKKKTVWKRDISSRDFLSISLALVLFVATVGIGVYFKQQYEYISIDTSYSAIEMPKTDAVSMVGRLIKLPKDEKPSVTIFSDENRIAGQPFIKTAKNGDISLIYSQLGEAILYRPALNKIVGMAYLIENEQEQLDYAELNQKDIKVAIANGSQTKGLAARLAEKLAEIKGVDIVKKINAIGDFEKTLVVDLTGKNASAAGTIAQAVDGEISQLPNGELAPSDAEILVIGADVKSELE